MDFHSLTRKELQTLCKKNKIPANMTNVAMADALAALENVEGLEELINQSHSPEKAKGAAAAESPLPPRTVARTSTRRKPINEDPEETAQPLTRTRRATRRTITVDEVLDKENKNNDAAETTTPAVQTRTGRRRTTTQVASTSAAVRSTRRSVRLLEKTMAELSLNDKQRAEPEPVKMESLDETDEMKKEKESLDQTDEMKKEKDVSYAAAYLEKATDSEIAIEEESSFKRDEKLGAEEDEGVQQVDPQAQSQSQSCDFDDREDNLSAVDAKEEDVTSSAVEMEPAVVIPAPFTDEFEFPSETEKVSNEISSQEVTDYDLLPVPGDQNASSQELKSETDKEFLPEATADRSHFVTESPNTADAMPNTAAAADDQLDQLAPECVEKEEHASEDELVDGGLIQEAQFLPMGTPEEIAKQQITSPCEANVLPLELGKQMNDSNDYSVCGGNGNTILPLKAEAVGGGLKQKQDNKEKISSQEVTDYDLLPVPGDQNASSQELKSETDKEFLPEATADRSHFVTESPNTADALPNTAAAADDQLDQLTPECVEKEEHASEDELVDGGLIQEAQFLPMGTPEESAKQQITSPCEANVLPLELGKQMNDSNDYSVCGGNGNPILPLKAEAVGGGLKQKQDNKENIVAVEALNDKSLRQLTRMLKEKLQISNKNKKDNNNNEEDQNKKMIRPALQTLPENLINNNNPNKHI